jgi:hypothetical protein
MNEEDLQFLKRFLLASGSLKALAKEYGVSYPTVRSRLDRLMAKVKAADDATEEDSFSRQVRVLVADGALNPTVARALMESHRETMSKGASNHAV